MTRDDIIRMARDAGFTIGDGTNGRTLIIEGDGNLCVSSLMAFATLVAEAERKACTKICTDRYEKYLEPEVFEIAEAIMSRFPTLSELLESKHS